MFNRRDLGHPLQRQNRSGNLLQSRSVAMTDTTSETRMSMKLGTRHKTRVTRRTRSQRTAATTGNDTEGVEQEETELTER